jgi:hypothetical protein
MRDINVSQTRIAAQFSQYLQVMHNAAPLEYTKSDIDIVLDRLDFSAKRLRDEQERGLCYGFAVVYSAFAHTDQLGWWFSLLSKINQWDGTHKALGTMTPIYGELIPKTLGQLFEIALQMVMFHQAMCDVNSTKYIPQDQNSLLDPRQSYFSLTDPAAAQYESKGYSKSDAPLRVKSRAHFFGKIDEMLFCALLEAGSAKSDMIILQNSSHACSLSFKNGYFYFYDANDLVGEQRHDTLSSLFSAVNIALPGELNLDFHAFSDVDYTYLYAIYGEHFGVDLLYDNGLIMMATEQSYDYFGVIIDRLMASDDSQEIQRFLTYLLTPSVDDELGLVVAYSYARDHIFKCLSLIPHNKTPGMVDALCQTDATGHTGWNYLASMYDDTLMDVLRLVGDEEKPAIVMALCKENVLGVTGWHHMARYKPKATALCLAMVNDTQKKAVVSALSVISNTNSTGWLWMASSDSENLNISLAMVSDAQKSLVVDALCAQDDNENTGWGLVISAGTDSLAACLDWVSEDKKADVVSAFCKIDGTGNSCCASALRCAPQQLARVILMLESADQEQAVVMALCDRWYADDSFLDYLEKTTPLLFDTFKDIDWMRDAYTLHLCDRALLTHDNLLKIYRSPRLRRACQAAGEYLRTHSFESGGRHGDFGKHKMIQFFKSCLKESALNADTLSRHVTACIAGGRGFFNGASKNREGSRLWTLKDAKVIPENARMAP